MHVVYVHFISTSSPQLPQGGTRNSHAAQLDLERVYCEVNLGVRVEGEIDPSYRIRSLISHSVGLVWDPVQSLLK